MSLSAEQFARAADAEASQLRALRLQSMSHRELHSLLCGDPVEAARWVRSAAVYGIPAAQLRFGRMLLEGRGVARDPDLALHWFARAAQQDAEAMNMVGRCYENGWGAPADAEIAAQWYEWSALRGHDWGRYNFANMLFDGSGVAMDRIAAVRWYRLASQQGHSRAMNLLGRCCEEAWGCAKNPGEAFKWYRRSAEAGYFRGQFNYAASLAEQGLRSEAAAWFRKARAGSASSAA
jgi:uncharacterized protein